MTCELRHVGIVSENPDESVDFWHKCFGFSVFWDMVEPSPYINNLLGIEAHGLRTIKMRSEGGSVIEFLVFPKLSELDSSPRDRFTLAGLSHIAITVPDINSCLERALESGAVLVSTKILAPPNSNVGVAYVLGPDQVFLELVQDRFQDNFLII